MRKFLNKFRGAPVEQPQFGHHDPIALYENDEPNNEKTPLLGSKIKITKVKVGGGIVCCLVTIGSTIAMALTLKNHSNGPDDIPIEAIPNVSFNFLPPGNIFINNNGNTDIEVLGIQFTTNAIINSVPTGPLSPSGSSLTTQATNGNLITYKLAPPTSTNVIIKANGSGNLVYSFDKAQGVFDVGILPQQIMLTTAQGNANATLVNQCSGKSCNDPFPDLNFGGAYRWQDMYQEFSASQIRTDINTVYYERIGINNIGGFLSIDKNADSTQIPNLMKLVQQYPYMKVILSIGGKEYAPEFANIAKNSTLRDSFSNNTVALLKQFNFAGIEIDWQPEQAQGTNYVQLFQNLNMRLSNYLVVARGSTSPTEINKLGFRLHDVAQYLDFVRVNGNNTNPFAIRSDYQSPMALPPNDPNGISYSINATFALYQHYLLPLNKTVMEIPTFYSGIKVANMSTNDNGIWKIIVGAPSGQFANETGVYYYDCAVKGHCYGGNPLPTSCQYLEVGFFGNVSKTPLIQCPEQSIVLTGESPLSVEYKTNYALKQNVKGISFWPLSGDSQTNNNQSLVTTAQKVIESNNQTSTVKSDPANTSIPNALEWKQFVDNIQNTITSSFFGGIGYTAVFMMVDKLTETAINTIFPKDEFDMEEAGALYFSAKSAVYFAILSIVGVPLLPAVAGKLVAAYLSESLNSPNIKAMLAGGFTSFLVNLANQPELYSQAGIAYAVTNFVSSLGGGMTIGLAGSGFQMAKSWYNKVSNFGFFAISAAQETNIQEIDIEKQKSLLKS